MEIKTSYIVKVNGKKHYKKTLAEAMRLYEKKKYIYTCELICVNKRITHRQLSFLDIDK